MRKLINRFFVVIMMMLIAVVMLSVLSSCKKQPADSKAQGFNPQVDGVAVMPVSPLDVDKAKQILNKVENTAAPAPNPTPTAPTTNIPSATEPNMPPKNKTTDPNFL